MVQLDLQEQMEIMDSRVLLALKVHRVQLVHLEHQETQDHLVQEEIKDPKVL